MPRRRHSSPTLSAPHSYSFILSVLLLLVSLRSFTSADLLTTCNGTAVLPLTPPAPISFNISGNEIQYFYIVVPEDINPMATQLSVTVTALDLPNGAWGNFTVMFLAGACPDAHCVRNWLQVFDNWDCNYQYFFLLPFNNVSLGSLAPPIQLPGSPPSTSQIVSATLAPLVPAQLIFAVWYNNTALPEISTQIIAEASFEPIPSFEETFTDYNYVGYPMQTYFDTAMPSQFYTYTLPPRPYYTSILDEMTWNISYAPCDANTNEGDVVHGLSQARMLTYRSRTVRIAEVWNFYPQNVLNLGTYNATPGQTSWGSITDFDLFAGTTVLLLLNGFSGGCKIKVAYASTEYNCGEQNCQANYTYGTCVSSSGQCLCPNYDFPNDTYPNCTYDTCHGIVNGTANVTFDGGFGMCRQPCLNYLPVGRCAHPLCYNANVGYRPVWYPLGNTWECQYDADYYPWWPWPLAALLVILTLIAAIIVMNLLANTQKWSEAGMRLIHPDETRSAV